MESSIAVFLMRYSACALVPTKSVSIISYRVSVIVKDVYVILIITNILIWVYWSFNHNSSDNTSVSHTHQS